jgi:hypothetical protein
MSQVSSSRWCWLCEIPTSIFKIHGGCGGEARLKCFESIRTPIPRDDVELPIREVALQLACCFFHTIRNLKDIVALSILSIRLVCTGTYTFVTFIWVT